ncbi:DUF3221 domain-containing protein [Pontibacter rugosus]|uniref:DUF3221 domain-containing protein n=1 Tax=Pontibacter rugosus TaxID=1745966 RepID=A0ABW3SWB1_9BACT
MKKLAVNLTFFLSLVLLLSNCNQQKRMPDTQPDVHGYVTNIKRTAGNKNIGKALVAVKALEGIETKHAAANIKIDENTLIEDQNGKALKLSNLREGHEVQAWFDGEVVQAAPVQGYAKAVRITY